MKLIYANGACSLSVHVLLEEIGRKYEALRVSLEDKTVLEEYNEKSYVPALELDDGTILTEATSILQFLADINERRDLLPSAGTIERAKTIEWLTFITTELHKGFGPLFMRDKLSKDYLEAVTKKIDKRLNYFNKHLSGKKFIMGDDFTIADMYAIAILRIGEHVKVDYTRYPEVLRYKKMLENMPVISKIIELENSAEVAKAA